MNRIKAYHIEIRSNFEESWRHNIAVTCGLFDADGNRCGFVPAEDSVASVGSNLATPPKRESDKRILAFDADDCARLLMYIYVIPHSLPQEKAISKYPPYPLHVNITYNGKTLLNTEYRINQWGGASLEIKAER